MTVAFYVRVSGRVQGVFYRAWTAEQAAALGVAGWVRNCADGSVEALLEGPQEAVDALIDRMRRGPPAAGVTALSIEPAPPGGASGFSVRH